MDDRIEAAAHAAQPPPPGTVRRRHVFYVSGFDPQGPSRYHGLYATEAALQSGVNGMATTVSRRHNDGKHTSWWDVEARAGDSEVRTRYEFMRWDDIVRTEWPRGRMTQVAQTFRTIAHYLRTGALDRMRAIYPVSYPVCLTPALLIIGIGLWVVISAAAWWGMAQWAGVWLAAAAWTVGVAGAVAGAWVLEARMQLAWLMRSYAFTARYAGGRVPALDDRLRTFGRRIAEVVSQGNVDEVLVVGHSSGVKMAVTAVARAIEVMSELNGASGTSAKQPPPALALLTLGHCVPVLSALREAQPFRDDLRAVAHAAAWAWLDVTAPADGCSFVLIDPTVGCDDVPGAANDRPKLVSPRFATLFSAQTYARVVRDKMGYHFRYLMATERAGAYDYFAITAGPITLATRFAQAVSITDFHTKRRVGKGR